MKITFFHWAANNAPSINRSFDPLITQLKKNNEVVEYRVPYAGANPINVWKNIWFVYKNRTKEGINHISGDIHYCILGLIGVKSVLTIHDDYAIIKAPNWVNRIYKWLFWIFLPVKLASRTVCITEATKKKILKYVKSRKILVITHHVVAKGFVYTPYVFNVKNPTILQIGATYQKNLETTILALRGIKCQLRVIKKMSEKQHTLAKACRLNYSNAYNLTDEQIIEEYVKADIVVFPSLYEGFGMPIIEAQAIGRPVITSDLDPMNWVAGENALLLRDPKNVSELSCAIKYLIVDKKGRENIIREGLKNVKRFSINKVMADYITLYNEII